MAQIEHQDEKSGGPVHTQGSDHRMNVSSRQNPRLYYISRDKAGVFNWSSSYTTLGGDEDVIYIKNTSSTKKLYIDKIVLGTVVHNVFIVKFVDGTAGGASAITGVNWNRAVSAETSDIIATGDAEVTGLTGDITLDRLRVPANSCIVQDYKEAIILGQGKAIAIQVVSAGAIEVVITGAVE